MNTLKIGDKVTTVGDFPTVGIIKEFGYIPKDVNLKAFIETDQFKGSLVAIDLTWAKLVKAPKTNDSKYGVKAFFGEAAMQVLGI